jgi:hypothetical protein
MHDEKQTAKNIAYSVEYSMKILDYGRGFRYICTKPKSEINEKNDIFYYTQHTCRCIFIHLRNTVKSDTRMRQGA